MTTWWKSLRCRRKPDLVDLLTILNEIEIEMLAIVVCAVWNNRVLFAMYEYVYKIERGNKPNDKHKLRTYWIRENGKLKRKC